jgi:hypothetical protein
MKMYILITCFVSFTSCKLINYPFKKDVDYYEIRMSDNTVYKTRGFFGPDGECFYDEYGSIVVITSETKIITHYKINLNGNN